MDVTSLAVGGVAPVGREVRAAPVAAPQTQPAVPQQAKTASKSEAPRKDSVSISNAGQASLAAANDLSPTERQQVEKAEAETREREAKANTDRLNISYNDDAQLYVYKALNRDGDTVRQYPTDEALKRITVLRNALDQALGHAAPAQGRVVNQAL
ncbi:MAG: flagellar protein FlaG [Alphaproteobacteria bacterium]|nr:flagellar protein FlaG [Alphaproteobacteria bacterium]